MVSASFTTRLRSSSIEIEPSVEVTALLTCLQLTIGEFEMLFLRIVLFLSLIIATPCFGKGNTILVLGDSLSAAHGIELEQGWVSLLQNRLDQNHSDNTAWIVVNASVSGETTAGALARLPDLLDKHQPNLCIIELGANNGLRGQSVSLMQEHLNEMVEQCKEYGTTLLLGIRLPPNYGKKYTEEFHHIYNFVAEKNNIPVVPFILDGIALQEKYMQTDGLHPTAAAQSIILENIWPTLCNMLNSL